MHSYNLMLHAIDQEFERVIDLGVGLGEHARAFIATGSLVTGVDVRECHRDMVDHSLYKHVQCPIESLGFEEDDKPYDMVWCSHTLEHMPNVQFALRQMDGFLKEDGWLYISVPSGSQDRLHVGHLTLWSPALLIYNLICAGWDCSDALWYTNNQTIGLCVKKKQIADMTWRTGLPVEALEMNKYAPVNLKHEHGAWIANNWPWETGKRVIDPPMVTAGVQETNLPPQVQLAFGPNPKLREGYERGVSTNKL